MKFILVLALALVGGAAQAASGGGSDGCGLGWQVTQKKSLLGTSTRATTNNIVPPTFGMTTGTIGCDQHSIAMRDVPSAQFVATNYDALMMDMALGQGENLAALAESLGCADVAAFGSLAKKNFSSLTQDADSRELVRRLRSLGCSA